MMQNSTIEQTQTIETIETTEGNNQTVVEMAPQATQGNLHATSMHQVQPMQVESMHSHQMSLQQMGQTQYNQSYPLTKKGISCCRLCCIITFLILSLITVGVGQSYASYHGIRVVDPFLEKTLETRWWFYGATMRKYEVDKKFGSNTHQQDTWKDLCDKERKWIQNNPIARNETPMECAMVDKGTAWTAVNIASIIAASGAIAAIIFISYKKNKNTNKHVSAWPVRTCLVLAAILQGVSIMVWEINSPFHDDEHEDSIAFQGTIPTYNWITSWSNAVSCVGFFIAAAIYKQA